MGLIPYKEKAEYDLFTWFCYPTLSPVLYESLVWEAVLWNTDLRAAVSCALVH